jgi:hypothetical protein
MSPTTRTDLLAPLAELGRAFPDWRFGQLVANVATAARGPTAEAIWDAEDEEFVAAARRLIERNRDVGATAPPMPAASI